MNCSLLVHNLFLTCLWFSWLVQYLFITCSLPVHEFFMTSSWLIQYLFINWSLLLHNLFMCYSWLVQDFFMTCSHLAHNLVNVCSISIHKELPAMRRWYSVHNVQDLCHVKVAPLTLQLGVVSRVYNLACQKRNYSRKFST